MWSQKLRNLLNHKNLKFIPLCGNVSQMIWSWVGQYLSTYVDIVVFETSMSILSSSKKFWNFNKVEIYVLKNTDVYFIKVLEFFWAKWNRHWCFKNNNVYLCTQLLANPRSYHVENRIILRNEFQIAVIQ